MAEQISEAFRFSRFNTATSEDVQTKATEALHLAISDAAESWVLYFHDPTPDATFPVSFLPESSRCFVSLEATTKTSDMAVDLAADVPRFMQAMGAASSPQPPPTKRQKQADSPSPNDSKGQLSTGACSLTKLGLVSRCTSWPLGSGSSLLHCPASGSRPKLLHYPASGSRPKLLHYPASGFRPKLLHHPASGSRPKLLHHTASGSRPKLLHYPASGSRPKLLHYPASGSRPKLLHHTALGPGPGYCTTQPLGPGPSYGTPSLWVQAQATASLSL